MEMPSLNLFEFSSGVTPKLTPKLTKTNAAYLQNMFADGYNNG